MNIPSLDFALGEDINLLRDAVKAFADAEIAPRAAEIDRVNEFPADLWKKFGDMGLLGMTAGEEYGGTNMGYLAHIVALDDRASRHYRRTGRCQKCRPVDCQRTRDGHPSDPRRNRLHRQQPSRNLKQGSRTGLSAVLPETGQANHWAE